MGSSVGIIAWIIIGGLAGFVAGKLLGTSAGQGWILDIIIGIIGGFVGGFILNLLGVDVKGGHIIFSFFSSLLGSLILIFAYKKLAKKD